MRLEKRISLCYANEDQESSTGYPFSEQFRGDEAERRMWLPKKGDAYDTLFSATEEDNPSMAFPSTRFYGSKRRQLSWLQTELSRVQGRTALDAFGGTGAVSYLLGKLGFHTTYNDIFEFNTISARAVRLLAGLTLSV